MKIYILGKIGKLTYEEKIERRNASIQLTQEGNEPVNFNHEEASVTFENPALQLANELSYLIEAEAVALLPDFNGNKNAELMLLTAIELNLPIHPANNCVIPKRLTYFLNF